jgi:hypothetical protein
MIEAFAEDLESRYSKSKALKEFDGRDKSAFQEIPKILNRK